MESLLKGRVPYILGCTLLSSAILFSTGCSNEGSDGTTDQSETASTSLLEKTTAAATAVVDDAKNAVEETVASATAVVTEAKTAVVEKTEAVKQAVAAKGVAPAVDGAKVYASCAGCHGSRAEGGVGPNLNAQTSSKVVDKLSRYKAGEQIGPMSGMMTPIAKELSSAEIKAVAEYVVTLE